MSDQEQYDLDRLAQMAQAARLGREAEIREAFRDPDRLRHQITRDAANVVASVGGYAVPLDKRERDEWLRRAYLSDPVFHAKVMVVARLVHEYAEHGAMRLESLGGVNAEG